MALCCAAAVPAALAFAPAAPLPLAARRGCQSSAACRMMVQKDAELPRVKNLPSRSGEARSADTRTRVRATRHAATGIGGWGARLLARVRA